LQVCACRCVSVGCFAACFHRGYALPRCVRRPRQATLCRLSGCRCWSTAVLCDIPVCPARTICALLSAGLCLQAGSHHVLCTCSRPAAVLSALAPPSLWQQCGRAECACGVEWTVL